MTLNDVKAKLREVLLNFGVILPEKDGDFSIVDYIVDSFQYISILVDIEQEFGIELPEEMLNVDAFSSFDAFCNALHMLVQESQ